jgi:hypothetical protein
LKLATDAPGREGWDSFRNYDYEVSPNEHRAVGAQTRKRGEAFTVILYDMDEAVAEKRGGQIAAVFDHLQPPGFRRESFAGKKTRPLDAERLGELKGFIEKARAELRIPGVAISLYQDGKIVFEGGFGVREQGQSAPVDAETLFMVASNTKSMSTLLLATLVDEGKLTWDTPVVDVMPNFKLGDPETTRHVLIKHLVCACTGLPRVSERHPRKRAGFTRDLPANEQVRRAVPILESPRRGRWVRCRACDLPRARAGRRLR